MHLCYDPATDRLILAIRVDPRDRCGEVPLDLGVAEIPCILDVAGEGRLLGIELRLAALHPSLRCRFASPDETLYLELESDTDPRVVRSVVAPGQVRWHPATGRIEVCLPRRTTHYELLYPSGAT
ncbi:MAG: DUF2283 domain-containing protein [Thermomicrobium sp.]|nr:hypothetical protein [Thermomicrobium sp.]MDW8060544.1 DUF2283 domain-containing protein [Thermomicrobium sp.]